LAAAGGSRESVEAGTSLEAARQPAQSANTAQKRDVIEIVRRAEHVARPNTFDFVCRLRREKASPAEAGLRDGATYDEIRSRPAAPDVPLGGLCRRRINRVIASRVITALISTIGK
jgi:hypothetical protein